MAHIPVHILQDRTPDGLQIRYMDQKHMDKEADTMGLHRDDHYIFFLLEGGTASLMIDFNEVSMTGSVIYYILPGQVHYRIRPEAASGWFIAIDTALVSQECRKIFESQLILQQPYALNTVEQEQCSSLLRLLTEKYNAEDNNPFYMTIVQALLQSFLAIAAGYYSQSVGLNLKASRPAQITGQFKQLLNSELGKNKSPAAYASMLNITESYLSEALKKQTGFTASYWIQQEVIMEAKRLLYYSQLSVKEIAHTLGYTDHSYFSRFFRKATGTPAIAFRQKYRK
ncbi:transcriptional regulator, AraC family [Pedobacter westerhofensis]|uniref:Transcriptional regulator, AraC family n=1 Tax=Pedobacter westerhofensis TaxID=425512 RepID=A0A521CY55_9SPHI|nr:AraC family transcriptional regulator [Pedobacter westerhofensis]SMO63620.1 transcriptional regulator, AraC family [Pedobacter westerhofensis]